jgi:ATP-dependent DNA helicase DinG
VGLAIARVDASARQFFEGLRWSAGARGGVSRAPGSHETKLRYTADSFGPHAETGLELVHALGDLASSLRPARRGEPRQAGDDDASPAASAEGLEKAVAALEGRVHDVREDLRLLLRADDPDLVFFLESRNRGVFLRAAPINVSTIVRGAIFDRFTSVVLTSATLAVDRSFEYVRGRLGIQRPRELRVASEFDYPSQALLYLPRRMPAPNKPEFVAAAAREAIEILRRSRGRAFVLFTSHAALRAAEPLLGMALPYPLLVQGSAPRSLLIEEFRRTPGAVLLGTSSFWQGVDVVGEALSCVIIDRLPFASPGDPVTAARVDAIRDAGGEPFDDYQVPLAILALLQGLGRLLRHRSDRGVLAILDPRLRTKSYGRRFLASLPTAPVTHDLDAVERFFK